MRITVTHLGLVIIFSMTLFQYCCLNRKISSKPESVIPGIDVLLHQRMDIIRGKRVGLITNPTGVTSNLKTTIDALHEAHSVKLAALFGPEHGVRGDIEGGLIVPQYIDEKTGVPVFSLYGKTKKPTPEMLENIDILIYDIQDIGSRAYTFIYTMAYAMEAAKEAGIPFIVLDRPNPLGGHLVEGNVLDPQFSSFIGLYPIPFIYGMTVGELALLFNEEFNIHCKLNVIPMGGWKRDMLYEDTGLIWILPSPHIPHAMTSFFEATTGCIGELGTVSVGVGYTMPFQLIGAPWINSEQLATELNSRRLPGVYFRPLHFRPFYYSFIKEQCGAVQIYIFDLKRFSPSRVQLHILHALYKLYPEHDIFETPRIKSFNQAYGSDQIQLKIKQGLDADEIVSSWDIELQRFIKMRQKYLIYH